MHSLGQRRRAVELYIKYGLKATATIRELGYPNRAQAGELAQGVAGKRRKAHGPQPRAMHAVHSVK